MRYLPFAALLGITAVALLSSSRPAPADDKDKWGTIKGRIVWPDEVPEPKELNVDKDKQHCLSKGKITNEEWVIDAKSKGIRWVFVSLAAEPGGELPIHADLKAIKDKEVVMDQPCCRFEPHALGMRTGQVLVVKNSSPILHNCFYAGKGGNGNEAIQPKAEVKIADLKPSDYALNVSCTIHGWMQAKVRVFDHPYFAVTDADGNFEIKNAPAGAFRLKLAHDSGWPGGVKGKAGEKITIKGGQVNDLGKIEWKQ